MKICPKCKKKMKRAMLVAESEASWWKSEGFYIADSEGAFRLYERCLTCGTELKEDLEERNDEKIISREGVGKSSRAHQTEGKKSKLIPKNR